MTEIVFIFFSSLIIALSGAMMPGPLLTVTISESTIRGAKAGPLLIIGHGILETILVILLLLGLAPLFQMKTFFVIVAITGAGVLGWMSYGMFRSLPELTLDLSPSKSSGKRILFSGILMSLANPYWFIWWATIGMAYLVQSSKTGVMGVGAFLSGHVSGDFLWYAAVSFTVSRGKGILTDRLYRGVIGFCAGLLVVFAVYFLYAGIKTIVNT
ncbi:MAG: lysine transporter LysE [Nitrospirae bacterium]|nr:MAG: lysine transporter LysE [Nitrospirota bacterium]